MEILIIGHGTYAQGICSAAGIILGNDTNTHFINTFVDDEALKDKIDRFFENRDNLLVFTDMFGGSVNQTLISYMKKKNLKIITGINLPLVLELILKNKICDLSDQEIRNCIKESQKQIKFVNEAVLEKVADDFE